MCLGSGTARKNAIQVGNGSVISTSGNIVRVKDPSGGQKEFDTSLTSSHSKKTYGGWVTSYWFENTSGFTVYEANWVVPPTPLVGGAALVILISLEDSTQTYSLQAALEYNDVVTGWSVASWYISPSLTFTTSTTAVSPGQSITGLIELVSGTYYSAVFVGSTQVSSLGWTTTTVLPWANAAVEAYNTYTCLQYPDSTGITITLEDLSWSASGPEVYNTTCGETASFSNPYIYFDWD